MKRFTQAIFILLISLLFVQCQKELSFIGEPDPETPPIVIVNPEPIIANLQGNILDENNQPSVGVNVTVGTKTVTTDSKGYFRINNASLDKRTSLVIASKAGYFKGLRVFQATAGTNQVVIKLIRKTIAGTINGATGGDVTLSNGTKVQLPANSVVEAFSGNAYTGTVVVSAVYIDPSATDIAVRVPGSFAATDKNGSRVMLTSFGMMAVELEAPTGTKLQIKTGSVATLTSPIPPAAQATAPTTISLWFVDEQTGLWKEEGTANKQGGYYVGEVKHFSFWNCDVSQNSISISMTLQSNPSPLVHATVRITRSGTGWQTVGYGYTDSLGHVSGIVPPNESLLLEVLSPCGNVIYSQAIAPLTQSTDLGIITVAGPTTSVVNFTGKIVDCNGNAVTNGYAIITVNNMVRYAATDASGNFSVSFISCSGASATAQVIGVDQATQTQSSVSNVPITLPGTNAGNIVACGISSAQFINYTLDGTNYSITSAANDSLTGYFSSQGTTFSNVIIYGNQNPSVGNDNIYFNIKNATAIGTFPLSELSAQGFSGNMQATPINATLTGFASTVGDFYEGSFSGQFTDSSISHTISTTFRVRRSF